MSAQHFRPATHLSSPRIVVVQDDIKSNFGRRSISVDEKMMSDNADRPRSRSKSPWNPFQRKHHNKYGRQKCQKLTKAQSEEIEEEDAREIAESLDVS